jgi:hypothetical protein
MSWSRRGFMRLTGHILGGAALAGAGVRIFSHPAEDAEFIQCLAGGRELGAGSGELGAGSLEQGAWVGDRSA